MFIWSLDDVLFKKNRIYSIMAELKKKPTKEELKEKKQKKVLQKLEEKKMKKRKSKH